MPQLNASETAEMTRMRVGPAQFVEWQAGRAVVFDDSFEHEVWNLSSARRILLIFDLIHPDINQANPMAHTTIRGQFCGILHLTHRCYKD